MKVGAQVTTNRTDPFGLESYTQQQTYELLSRAFYQSTLSRSEGLRWIEDNSTNNYDFGYSEPKSTWIYNGQTLNADQMGNFIAGFQAKAYDDEFNYGVPAAQAAVKGAGVVYHMLGMTKAKNDPWDKTGIPDINRGAAAASKFKPSPNVKDTDDPKDKTIGDRMKDRPDGAEFQKMLGANCTSTRTISCSRDTN